MSRSSSVRAWLMRYWFTKSVKVIRVCYLVKDLGIIREFLLRRAEGLS